MAILQIKDTTNGEAEMMFDGDGLRMLSATEALARLANHEVHVGRLAFVSDGYPVVLPVNYRVLDGDIVFRTGLGGKLDAILRGVPLAFQVDHLDPTWESGWSVLAQGKGEEITDPEELARVQRIPVRPWGPGVKLRFVKVRMEHLSGREIT